MHGHPNLGRGVALSVVHQVPHDTADLAAITHEHDGFDFGRIDRCPALLQTARFSEEHVVDLNALRPMLDPSFIALGEKREIADDRLDALDLYDDV